MLRVGAVGGHLKGAKDQAASASLIRFSLFAVPPVRAKIVREWGHFAVGQAYNLSCQVRDASSCSNNLNLN